ncbi:sensor histidine kinase [Mucilaginibacter sp. OK098]|uniref:sensor histidine kinase n=1 Tax=Mucilaginibacter sp. OK098 TaxID=1855297 RepID=UPI00091455FC|nr:ATP-binding protein [Mucilaginibacter sp. OK098]SHM76923.1 Histidine kinase-, DNA gyrase B-, and HSP90-like ATPase [Mucilaginibacter sp. OK098]
MQTTISQETALTIIISTSLLLVFVCLITYFFFQQQKKRFLHQQEVFELRESFNQTILQSKLEIQERTLDHIAKELHANFSHLVSLININLSAILAESSGEVKEHISETKLLSKQLMSEIKVLSVSLNSDYIMKAGFHKTIENELQRLKKTGRYQVSYIQNGVPYRLPSGQEIVLFRLCQEILNNIVKHSQAKTVDITLDYSETALSIRIKDDGIGFDIDVVKERSIEKESTGLLNIAGRAKLINANLNIHSSPGDGTAVEVTIPIEN